MGGIGVYGLRPGPQEPGSSGAGCLTAVIQDQVALDALWPPVGGVHTVAESGAYCFKNFTMTVGNRIQVPTGLNVRFTGEGTHSAVTGSIAGDLVNVAAGSTFYGDNMKWRNVDGTAAADCIATSSTEVYLVQMAVFCPAGNALTVRAGRVMASQVRITDANNAIRMLAGEFYGTQLDVESVGMVAEVQGASDVLQLVGGRFNNFTTGVVQNADVSVEVVCSNLRVNAFNTWYFRNGGVVAPSVLIAGCNFGGQAAGQIFHPNGQTPANMGCIYENVANGGGGFFGGGYGVGSPNARIRANSYNSALQAEV